MYENQLYMMENPFYFPQMTPNDYEIVIESLAERNSAILNDVLDGKLKLIPMEKRTKEYIFGILNIK